MKLGSSQTAELERLVNAISVGDEAPSIVIGVFPWRKVSRGPKGHPIVGFIEYPNGDTDCLRTLSNVNDRREAEAKAAKFARHLVDSFGVPSDRVKCRRM